MSPPVLVISRNTVEALLDVADTVAALEAAFLAQARGAAGGPASCRLAAAVASGGAFHAKGARLDGPGPSRAAFKVNGNFPGNAGRYGLPTIQGLVVLLDAERGTPLAVMDSIEITALRTAAATAVARIQERRPPEVLVTRRRVRSIPFSVGCRAGDRRLIIRRGMARLPTTSQSERFAGRRWCPAAVHNFKRDLTLAANSNEWRSSPSSNIRIPGCARGPCRSLRWTIRSAG